MRSGPGTEYSILMRYIPQNEKVKIVTDSKNGWTKVTYKNKTGYISSQYLKVNK